MTPNLPKNAKCTAAQLAERHQAIADAGWRLAEDAATYVAWYVGPGVPAGIYLNKRAASLRVIVHPDMAARATAAAARTGADLAQEPYHDSGMSRFPLRVNGGKPIPYGLRVSLDSTGRLRAFLDALSA